MTEVTMRMRKTGSELYTLEKTVLGHVPRLGDRIEGPGDDGRLVGLVIWSADLVKTTVYLDDPYEEEHKADLLALGWTETNP